MSPKLIRNLNPMMVKCVIYTRKPYQKYSFRTLILPTKRLEPNVKVLRDTFVPELIFKYNPMKYYISKLKMWQLRWTWDRDFREKDFIDDSKETAIKLTDCVRSGDSSKLGTEFTKSNAYYQMANEAINFPHESCVELLRFRKEDIRRAVPIHVQMHSILGIKYAVIDVVMVALRQVCDFESDVDLNKVKKALIEMDSDLKDQLNKPDSQLPYVFIELFLRFRRNYTNTVETNPWLVSVYKICRFNVFTVPPSTFNVMPKSIKGKVAELNACKALLKKLMSVTYKKLAWIFYDPVDAQNLALDDYHEIVKEPMDLSTIKHRLESDFYKNSTEFAKDVRLIFFNAYLYTNPDHLCYQMAKELQLIFEKMFTQLSSNSNELFDNNPDNDDAEVNDDDNDDDDDDDDDDDSDVSSIVFEEHKEPLEKKFQLPHTFDDEPLTVEQDLDLHAKIQQLDGENLLNVIHIIQQLEDTKYSNTELEFDVRALKTRTKRSIEAYMLSKGITGRRRSCVATKYPIQNRK